LPAFFSPDGSGNPFVFLKRSGGNIKDCNEQREIAPEKKNKAAENQSFQS